MSLILPKTLKELDEFASAIGADWYTDPETGRRVMTSRFLRQRGWCCGCDCRHCPYSEEERKAQNKELL